MVRHPYQRCLHSPNVLTDGVATGIFCGAASSDLLDVCTPFRWLEQWSNHLQSSPATIAMAAIPCELARTCPSLPSNQALGIEDAHYSEAAE
jgi:hypothetical protein